MTQATATRRTRQSRLPAVSGTVKLLAAVGSVGPVENNTGEIAINGKLEETVTFDVP